MNGAPSASAVSEINQFFFCGPAVRPQKEDEIDWGASCADNRRTNQPFIQSIQFNHKSKKFDFDFIELELN